MGAGPVGCVATGVLAVAGLDVTLLEAAPELPRELRASTFHPATLDLLDCSLGRQKVVDEMLSRGLKAPRFAYRDRRKGVVAEFDLGTLADVTNHPFRLQCEQYKLCEIMLDRFNSMPNVTVRFNADVVAATNMGDAASVTLASGSTASGSTASGAVASGATASEAVASGATASGSTASGTMASGSTASEAVASGSTASGAVASGSTASGAVASGSTASGETLVADAVIGADGAASAVRKSLGLTFDGMTYEDRYLVLSTPFEMAAHLHDLAYVNYISDPDEWLVLLRTVDLWRALFPVGDTETDAEALSEPSAQRRLQGVVTRSEPYHISHRTIYRVHQRVADRFVVGRVVLMGDAAHINNPLGGMGMNGGIHDAVLLGASLAAVLRGDITGDRLDHHARLRRMLAIDYVKRHTHQNATSLAAPDGAARQRALDQMARCAADPDQARSYMLQASMIKALHSMSDELAEVGQACSIDRNTVSL